MTKLSPQTVTELLARINIPDWQDDAQHREVQPVIAAATGDLICEVPVGTQADVTAAFARARAEQAAWEATNVADRAKMMTKFATLVHDRRDELLDVIQTETGKARSHALEEVIDVMLVARFYASNAAEWLKPTPIPGLLPGLTKARVVRRPVGVVGVISPWNYPLSLSITDALAAIMAGNSVVLKPDSQTPLSALQIAVLLGDAGMPPGLLQLVTGSGRCVGTAIVEQCDYLMFTGSSATGKLLGGQIGSRLVGYSAELGGKNPMIVTEDVNIDTVADIITRACYSSAGQLCLSIERIYGVGKSYDRLLKVLPKRIKQMKLGTNTSWDTEMGSLTGPSQLETVSHHVDDALAKGAKLLAGGKPRPELGPFFYEPTLLAEVPVEATCYREETFGPVVSLYPAADIDEAIELANDTRYGLNASVMCNDVAVAQDIAERLNSGMVNI